MDNTWEGVAVAAPQAEAAVAVEANIMHMMGTELDPNREALPPPPPPPPQQLPPPPQLPPIEVEANNNNDNEEPPTKKRAYTHKRAEVISRKILHKSQQKDNEAEKLVTNQILLETATRMNDAISELITYANTLSDQKRDNKQKREEAIKNIRNSIIPMLHVAMVSARDAGMAFAPFGGTNGLRARNERIRKDLIIDKASEKSTALQMINDFVKKSVVVIPDRLQETTLATAAEEAKKGEDKETVTILKPKNGKLYTRSEALRVCKMYKKGTPDRGKAIRAMMAKGFLPPTVKIGNVYKLLKDDDKGYPIVSEDWSEQWALPQPNVRVKNFDASEIAAAKAAANLGKPSMAEMMEVTMKKKLVKGQPVPKDDDGMETITILRPINGKMYTKSEALRVAKMYKKGTASRGKALRAMIETGFVPASVKTINRLCQLDEMGHPITCEDWLGPGAPRKHFHQSEIAAATADMGKDAAATAAPELGAPEEKDMIKVTMKKPMKKKMTKAEMAAWEAEEAKKASKASGKKRKAPSSKTSKKGQAKKSESSFAFAKVTKVLSNGKTRTVKVPKAVPTKQSDAVQLPPPEPLEGPLPQVINFKLPEPEDGKIYKKSEAVRIARQYQKGSQDRKWCIEAMHLQGYVPNSTKSIYRLMAKDEKGEPIFDNEWNKIGCPPLLSNPEVDAIVARMMSENGRLYGKADVEQLLVNAVRQKLISAGRDPDEGKIRFSHSSIRNYQTIFMSKLGSGFWTQGSDSF